MSYHIPLESPPSSPIVQPNGLDTPINEARILVADSAEHTDRDIVDVPSDVELFIRNLRLLDLHLLPDWPHITAQTFRPEKDARVKQKARVSKAEWVLYRLFEIWDGEGTRNKLEQFFPPHEPIQSIKLRSGLYQLLNNLKQDGVLGPGCTLRKSMLDECKGDKFEELLFLLSTAVLRKVVEQRDGRLPIAQDLGARTQVSTEDENRLSLLSLAHHASIQSSLRRREIHKERLKSLEARYAKDELSIEQRQSQTMSALESHLTKLIDAQVDTSKLKRQLRDECPGDRTWLNTILSGDVYEGHDPRIEADFKQIWQNSVHDEPTSYDDMPRGLLVDLTRRVEEQRARLVEWKAFQKELSRRNENLIAFKSPFKSPIKSAAKPSPKSPAKSPKKTPLKRAQSQSKTFTNRLRSTDRPVPSHSSPALPSDHQLQAPPRDLSTLTSYGSRSRRLSQSATSSQTRVDPDSPLEARLQALLMHEPFESPSPAERDLRPNVPPSVNEMLPPPRPLHQRSRSEVPPSASKAATSLQAAANNITRAPESPNSPVTSSVSTDAAYTKSSISLTERTRQSISLAGKPVRHVRSSSVTSPSSYAAKTSSKPPSQRSDDETLPTPTQSPHLTLAERTQQSMLLMSSKKVESLGTKSSLSQSAAPSGTMSTSRPATSTAPKPSYSVNPFDTPGSHRTRSEVDGQDNSQGPLKSEASFTELKEYPGDGKRKNPASKTQSFTPQEVHTPQQQSQDEEFTEYESVFKTRSKMRRSPPPLTPARDENPAEQQEA